MPTAEKFSKTPSLRKCKNKKIRTDRKGQAEAGGRDRSEADAVFPDSPKRSRQPYTKIQKGNSIRRKTLAGALAEYENDAMVQKGREYGRKTKRQNISAETKEIDYHNGCRGFGDLYRLYDSGIASFRCLCQRQHPGGGRRNEGRLGIHRVFSGLSGSGDRR